ncbi:PP2C family protein-serine/threonine phosphatase [Sphingomonas sp. URHD0057]|uniref:PP2C family protein-serine/threonine phosphatase n=1 Tax=Sphingomonas sp. URHD0057 TaxID=1380389 RepID=UPI00068896E0|nr:protein phosphatase 2C domain-containing protein [Sphingomonas sp. URHD0057]
MGLRRKVNEDSIFERTERGLWAVADGMGGHEAGDVASAKVVEALRSLPIVYGLDELVEAAIDALYVVNRELIELARSGDHSRTIGTTVVGLAIADGHFRCFWAGDSRAYRIRSGQIRRLSRDHSLVQDLVDAGMLKAEDAEKHESANVITRAVGVSEDLQMDSSTGDADSGDIFLLASDGLTRLVDDYEILEELTSAPMDKAADKLVELVLARGAPDNVSIVLTQVH